MECVVYKITNTVTGKVYIGQTRQSLSRRWAILCSPSKSNHCRELYDDVVNYGRDSFTKEILVTCSSQKELDEHEDSMIQKYAAIETGYNKRRGGRNGRHTAESLKKMSIAQKGHGCSEEQRRKMSESRKGIKRTPEALAKFSISMKKKWKEDLEYRENSLSRLHDKNTWTEERRRKIGDALRAKKLPPSEKSIETLKKLNVIQKGELHPMYGKKHTEETRAKIKATRIRYPVVQLSLDGNFMAKYSSMTEAGKVTKIHDASISRAVRENLTAGGFLWKREGTL